MAIDTRHCACGLTFEVSEWSSRPDCDACREILNTPRIPTLGDILQNEYNASTYTMTISNIDDALTSVIRNASQRFTFDRFNAWGELVGEVRTENE